MFLADLFQRTHVYFILAEICSFVTEKIAILYLVHNESWDVFQNTNILNLPTTDFSVAVSM